MHTRTCPECGTKFKTDHSRQRFCTTAHKTAFYNLAQRRGQTLLPLVQVWRKSRGGDKYAFAVACDLLDRFNAEDKKAGRQPELVTAAKRASGWMAVDLWGARSKPASEASPVPSPD